MKYNWFAILTCLLLGSGMTAVAQDYDDVYYNANTDNDGSSTPQVTQTKPGKSTVVIIDNNSNTSTRPSVGRINTMDVDTYNRRGDYYSGANDVEYIDYDSIDTDEEFANTKRIQRFYNSDVVIMSGDDELIEIYYDEQPQINLIIGSNFAPGYRWGWGGWYGYYDPWYSSPYWDSWYGYRWYRPYWSWGWHRPYWGWGGWYAGWHGGWGWYGGWHGGWSRPGGYHGWDRSWGHGHGPGRGIGGDYRGRRPGMNSGRGGNGYSGRGQGSRPSVGGVNTGGRRPVATGNVNRANPGSRTGGSGYSGGTARRPSVGSSGGSRPSSGYSGSHSGGSSHSGGGYSSGGSRSGGYSSGGGRSSSGGGGFSGGSRGGGGGHSGGFSGGGGGRRR